MIVDQTTNEQSGSSQPEKPLAQIEPETKVVKSDISKGTYSDETKHDTKKDDDSKQDDEQLNESSNLSTAFTISFEDDTPSNTKKLFGIRDSIRKFAPPKPNTIEKPRPPKSESHENSYASIESAPGGGSYSRQTGMRRDANNSCRSSGRKSDSSRHSNISESAAFLIDKMLNCKEGESLSSICLGSAEKAQKDKKTRSKSGTPVKKTPLSSGDILDDEVDFCEDKSDNGTYIVGTDPESDAARRKIDELFGVVKAAEESLLAAGGGGVSSESRKATSSASRASRQLDKKPTLNRDRQEHINRLASGRHSSRSSSSSRQELATGSHRPRSNTRQPRNASCDRTSKQFIGRHKRATSHSSRHSSNREGASDGDTQSSRSSLRNDIDVTNNEATQLVNNPGMKFNRAFALRRARLGLGEPTTTINRLTSTPGQDLDPSSTTTSPRRALGLRYAQASSSGLSANISRSDGGRFSLRMKNNPPQGRLSAANYHDPNRAGQPGPIVDSYLSRLTSISNKVSRPAQSSSSSITMAHQQSATVHSISAIPYQSSDELELTSPSRFRRLNAKSNSSLRKGPRGEPEIDGWDYGNERLNYSYTSECDNLKMVQSNGACNSAGRRGSSGHLGALDCLVISAISTLSVKIRSSVCDLMIEHAKRLPSENETRLIVEEILPQLTANITRPKSPTSIEEIDQTLYFDLAQALKNLKKVEQMVDVMKLISNQMADSSTLDAHPSNPNSETNSLSPV